MFPTQPSLLNQMRRRQALQGDVAARAQAVNPNGAIEAPQPAMQNDRTAYARPQSAQQGETPLLSRISGPKPPQQRQAQPAMQNDRVRYARPPQQQQASAYPQGMSAAYQNQQQPAAAPAPMTQASYWNNVMSQPQQNAPQQPAYSTQSGMPERTQEQRDQQDRDNAASDSRSAAPQPQYRQHDFGGSDPKGGGFQKMADGGVIQGIQDFLFGNKVLRKLAGDGEGLRGTILGGYSAPGKQDYRKTKEYVDDTKQVKEMRGKQEADKKKKK